MPVPIARRESLTLSGPQLDHVVGVPARECGSVRAVSIQAGRKRRADGESVAEKMASLDGHVRSSQMGMRVELLSGYHTALIFDSGSGLT